MRFTRHAAILRTIGVLVFVLAVGTLALFSKPEWREYFAEAGATLGALVVARVIADGIRRRFLHSQRSSLFERALQREFSTQIPPSQLLLAISMAASPEKSTFDLLASTADRRLHDRHGVGLDDEKARDLLGPDVYDLLHTARRSGPTWALRKRSPRWSARLVSGVFSAFRRRRFGRRSPAKSQNTSESGRSASVEQVRTILTRLEQL